MSNCPECEEELLWHDYYGRMDFTTLYEKYGDIFKCEKCEITYHTRKNDSNLYEGMPC